LDVEERERFGLGIKLAHSRMKSIVKGGSMKNQKLISVSFLAAAAIALNTAPTWAQSRGGTQSERSPDSDTPVSKGSPFSGTDDASKAKKSPSAGESGKGSSVGGSQSERSTESDAPVSKGSRFSGTEDRSKAQKSPRVGQSGKDSSIGGTQSKRSTESDTPVTEGRFSDSGKTDKSSRPMSQASGIGSQQDVRQAQEALKNQGHDPGPIDGVMGPQTRQALREFQGANGLKQTGMVDTETKQKLNIENSSTRGSSPMGQKESAPMGK
jgi:Putative peptidoglycan binding domain